MEKYNINHEQKVSIIALVTDNKTIEQNRPILFDTP